MTNRVMQQKALKRVKQGRLNKRYRSEYVHINIPRTPEFFGNPAGGIPSLYLKGTTSAEEAERKAHRAYIAAMFPSLFGLETNEPRKLALRYARFLSMLGEVEPRRHVVLHKSSVSKLMMFFNIKHDEVFFVEIQLSIKLVKRSITYGSRDHALAAKKKRKIQWQKPWFYDNEIDELHKLTNS